MDEFMRKIKSFVSDSVMRPFLNKKENNNFR